MAGTETAQASGTMDPAMQHVEVVTSAAPSASLSIQLGMEQHVPTAMVRSSGSPVTPRHAQSTALATTQTGQHVVKAVVEVPKIGRLWR